MIRLFFILFLLSTFVMQGTSQKPPETEAEFEKAYERRIRQTFLNGVYIPKDIGDAFKELNRLIDASSKKTFLSINAEQAAEKLHFSFGRWMVHNWGFYGGSRFTKYLNQINLYHPDDMSRFVIITYHRNLKRQPLEVKSLVEQLKAERAELEAEKKKNAPKTILSEEKRKREN